MKSETTVTLKYKSGEPLNGTVDYILLEKAHLIERLSNFELSKGMSTLFGSGEDQILEITMKYINPSKEDLADIDDIITTAKNIGSPDGASELIVVIDGPDDA